MARWWWGLVLLAGVAHAAPPAAKAPMAVLAVAEAPLLRSEQRGLDRLGKQLGALKRPVTVGVAEGARADQLRAWLDATDPAARAKLPVAEALGTDGLVLAIRYAPAPDKLAKRPLGFVVLQATAPHEVFWAQGMGPVSTAMAHFIKILKELP
ncbi:MAG: hypothetical protein H6706_29825 [Myxococcales bacterium]|nr:hypothetical protein [Myxococcales bacterium]